MGFNGLDVGACGSLALFAEPGNPIASKEYRVSVTSKKHNCREYTISIIQEETHTRFPPRAGGF